MKNLLSYFPPLCFHNMATRDFQNILWFHCMDVNRYTSALYFIDAAFQHSKKSLLFKRSKKIHELWHCPEHYLTPLPTQISAWKSISKIPLARHKYKTLCMCVKVTKNAEIFNWVPELLLPKYYAVYPSNLTTNIPVFPLNYLKASGLVYSSSVTSTFRAILKSSLHSVLEANVAVLLALTWFSNLSKDLELLVERYLWYFLLKIYSCSLGAMFHFHKQFPEKRMLNSLLPWNYVWCCLQWRGATCEAVIHVTAKRLSVQIVI